MKHLAERKQRGWSGERILRSHGYGGGVVFINRAPTTVKTLGKQLLSVSSGGSQIEKANKNTDRNMEIKKPKAVRDEFPLKLMFQLGKEISNRLGRFIRRIRCATGSKAIDGFLCC